MMQQTPVVEKQGTLSRDRYKPDDFVSTGQYVFQTSGSLPTRYGCNAAEIETESLSLLAISDQETQVMWS